MADSWRIALAAFSAFLLVVSYPKFHFYIFVWVAPVLLMIAVAGARLKVAALCGWVQGFLFYVLTINWLDTTFQLHGGVSPFMAAFTVALISAVAALYRLAFAWCFAWLLRRSLALACIAVPFLWVASEFGLYSMPAIGFPWNLLGYAAAHSLALLQLAPLAGVWGLGFVIGGFNAMLFWGIASLRARRFVPVVVTCGVTAALVLVAAFGDRWVPQAVPDHTARLVQTNFPEPESFPPDWLQQHAGEMNRLEKMSTDPAPNGAPAGLVIWPEVPAPFSMQEPRFAAQAAAIGRGATDGFLVGVIDWKVQPGGGWHAYNSAALMDPGGRETFLYDKIHLVPFAEYVPFSGWFAFVRRISVEVGNFQSGTEYKVGALPDGHRFSVYICYEAIFGGEIRRFVSNGAQLLVNISNDGWFGRSAAPEQHVAMARVRAVENRRWMLRSTNNGYTMDVDPYGRVIAQLPTDTRAVLEAPYAYRSDLTLYTRRGDWLPWLSVFASFGLVGFARIRARRWAGQTPEATAHSNRRKRSQ
jgi:apolipoprotein N-acyltransferase